MAKAIDLGLSDKNLEGTNSALNTINIKVTDELKNIANELLQKAGLIEMNEKLMAFK